MTCKGRPQVRFLGLTLIWACIGLTGCLATDETPPAAESAELPDQQIYDYQLIDSEEGIKQWVLVSERMEKYADQDEVELYVVDMQFFKAGEYYSTLTAERGRANLSTKQLFAWGNVVVVTSDERRLEAEELYYDDARELIHNDVFNRFTWGEDLMTGYGLEATPDLEYLEIKEQVSAEVEDEGLSESRQQ